MTPFRTPVALRLLAGLCLASPAAAATDWVVTEEGLLEMKLAHAEAAGPDGGILRVDASRRRLSWEGIPGELGCRESVDAAFEEVRSVTARREGGFTLELRGAKAKLVLMPLPHAGWLNASTTVTQGLSMGVTESLRGPGDLPLQTARVFGGPKVRRLEVPDDVRYDSRRAVETLLEALGRVPTPGAQLRETFFGVPVEVSLAELHEMTADHVGHAVRVRAPVEDVRTEDGTLLLASEGASLRLTPVPEIARLVWSRATGWKGQELEVAGVLQRSPTEASTLVVSFWDFIEPGAATRQTPDGAERTLAELAAGAPEGIVRAVGRFRGRNLYGDLPAASQRGRSDWVIKDGPIAVWVTGKAPRGSNFKLDADSTRDAESWVEVSGRVESRDGITYLRAVRVALAPPRPGARVRAVAVTTGRAAIPPVVVFSLPLDGEDEVARDSRFAVQFSKPMNEETFRGHVVLRYPGGRTFEAPRLAYDEGRRALLVDPGTLLDPARDVELLLLPGILDVDGRPLTPRKDAAQALDAVVVLRYRVGI